MASLYFLIPLSVVVILAAVAIFFWAVNSGQYDDLDADGEKILFDDEDDFTVPDDAANESRTSNSFPENESLREPQDGQ